MKPFFLAPILALSLLPATLPATAEPARVDVTVFNHASYDIRVAGGSRCRSGITPLFDSVVRSGSSKAFECSDATMYDDGMSLYQGSVLLCHVTAINDGSGGFNVENEQGSCDASRTTDYSQVSISYNP